MKNYISFSLYGLDPIYVEGALQNAQDALLIYPGWQSIFYLDDELYAHTRIHNRLLELGANVVNAGSQLSQNPMCWRFAAALIPDAERVIFRDADSRLTTREANAVQAWVASGKSLHIMRDHPFHSNWILGGMWGCIASNVKDEVAKVLESGLSSKWGEDQNLLYFYVYKNFARDAEIHDSFFRREKNRKKFPDSRLGEGFVGERFLSNGTPEYFNREILKKYESNYVLRFKLLSRDFLRTFLARLAYAEKSIKARKISKSS